MRDSLLGYIVYIVIIDSYWYYEGIMVCDFSSGIMICYRLMCYVDLVYSDFVELVNFVCIVIINI